jgi:acyl-CoA synthetase (NDP forming)
MMDRTGLDPLFAPGSVAVIGASAEPSKRGFQILRALRESGFEGPVHPVNPRGGEILGWTVHRRVEDLPHPPDLAVICTPAATVPEVVEACGRRGIPGAVALAVGFGESGPEGAGLEQRVASAARVHGVRLMGPNTSGLLNLTVGLNLVGVRGVRAGALSLLVQSGNMALALMKEAAEASGEGIAVCAGLGNEVDVGFGESLDWLARHRETRAVLCYTEGMRDPRGFLQVAARTVRDTPVILLKAGRSPVGARAARSHTGAVAGPYDRFRAGLAQAGVVEVTRTDELLHVGETLAWQPPAGPGTGVAILTDGGGQGTLAADTLSEMGAALAELTPGTRTGLRDLLGPAAATSNPVDLAGAADSDPSMFPRALDLLVQDPGVGAVLVVGLFGGYAVRFAERLLEAEVEAARRMGEAGRSAGVALVVHSMYALRRTEPIRSLNEAHVPVVASLEVACRCVAEVWRRGSVLARPSWEPGRLPAPRREERDDRVLRHARASRRDTLTEVEARELLSHRGVRFPPAVLCTSPREAVAAAGSMEGPVALKVVSPGIPHKTEAGGVALGVHGPEAVRAAFREIKERALRHLDPSVETGALHGVLVTPMQAPPLAELLVGVSRDPGLGPVLTLGVGGVWVELVGQVAHRVLPVEDDDVRALLAELPVGRILAGARGGRSGDVAGVVRVARGLARLVMEVEAVAEVEVNPLFVYPDQVVPVDARIFLRAPDAPTATPSDGSRPS